MKLQIVAKNLELSQEVRGRVRHKISKLDKRLRNITDVKVEISQEVTKFPQQRYVVQITLIAGGMIIRGEERAADIYVALNGVIEIMDRQIERYKGKFYTRTRSSVSREPSRSFPEEEGNMRIVKVKELILSPMSAEDAIVQMELLGHKFFVFLDSATQNTSVLYCRRDGGYGLLESRLG